MSETPITGAVRRRSMSSSGTDKVSFPKQQPPLPHKAHKRVSMSVMSETRSGGATASRRRNSAFDLQNSIENLLSMSEAGLDPSEVLEEEGEESEGEEDSVSSASESEEETNDKNDDCEGDDNNDYKKDDGNNDDKKDDDGDKDDKKNDGKKDSTTKKEDDDQKTNDTS